MTAISYFSVPRSRDDCRTLTLGLAERSSDELRSGERGAFDQLRDMAWDVATCAAFWRTVQLPSLGPGLLPWVVVVLLSLGQVVGGHIPDPWPSLSNPFFLWPSLWLVGWFSLTVVLAALRYSRAKHQVQLLGTRLGFFSQSAPHLHLQRRCKSPRNWIFAPLRGPCTRSSCMVPNL